MKKNKIILTAEAELVDKGAREFLSILERRIDRINKRTKAHTLNIKELNKKINENDPKN